MHFQTSIRFLFLVLCGILTGCAGVPSVTMSAADRAQIKTVSMKTPATLPEDMFFHGRAQSFAAVGGAIGSAMAQSAPNEPKQAILQLLSQHNISVQDILKTEFSNALESQGGLKLQRGEEPANADMSLVINVYGFGQTQGFSALLHPMINVSAVLKKPDGSVAWQKTDFVTPLNDANKPGYEFAEYVQNPELLRQAFTNVSRIVSQMLVKELAETR